MRERGILRSSVVVICICIICAGLTCTQSIAGQIIFQPYARPLAVPEFALENLEGRTVDIRDYRGQVILLNFSATW
jgi:cytochrome oxidase Cu insertion factor (SCO1/SenC/PrrC family)